MQDQDCGKRGLPCCDGDSNFSRCFAKLTGDFGFLRCSSDSGAGVCISCGGAGEPCCQRLPGDAPFCSRGNLCSDGSCEPCGERGEPCCEPRVGSAPTNSNRCFASQNGKLLTCSNDTGPGVCESCGGAGEPCCQRRPNEDPYCYRGNLCADGGCTPCGDPGEPCCDGQHDFQRCLSTSNNPLRCNADTRTCEVCGGAGEPCCQSVATRDPTCHLGNVCTSSGCEPCGELGEACCAGSTDSVRCHTSLRTNLLACSDVAGSGAGTCVECGGPGQPCCQPRPTDEPFCSAGKCLVGLCSNSSQVCPGTSVSAQHAGVLAVGTVCSFQRSTDADRRGAFQAHLGCGENGQPCCPGSTNRDFCPRHKLTCSSDSGAGTCEGCGGTGERCCQTLPSFTPSCDAMHACSSGRCEPCGSVGEICCKGNSHASFCPLGKDKRCSSDDGNGTCIACGGAGEPCCQPRADGEPSCDARHVCAGGQCEPCGEVGEFCCAGREHADFCPIGTDQRCSSDDGNGTCIACGGAGEPCCQRLAERDPECSRGNTCADGECAPCGERGERCCKGYAFLCPSPSNLQLVCSSEDGDGVCL